MQASWLRRSRSPSRVICFCLLSVATLMAAYTGLGIDGQMAVQAQDGAGSNANNGPSWFVAAQSWQWPVPVAEGLLDARYPRMVRDAASGNLYLTWEEAGQRVRYAYRDASGWHITPHAWQGYSPAIALDTQGLPHIVYAAETDASGHTQILHRSAADDWLPVNISGTNGNSQRPQISLLIGEQMHVTWVETLDSEEHIYHAVSNDSGATWLEMSHVALGTSPSLDAGAGQVWLVWQGAPQSQVTSLKGDPASDIYGAQWQAAPKMRAPASSGAWGEAENLSLSFEQESRSPDVACAEDGLAYVAWEELAADGESSLVALTWHDGEGWRAPLGLSEEGAFATGPQVVWGGASEMGLAWDAGSSLRMRSGWCDDWAPAQTIATFDSGIADVCLVADESDLWQAVFSVRTPMEPVSSWVLYHSEQAYPDTATPPCPRR